MANTTPPKVTVLYLAGAGRSGSTILDLWLGQRFHAFSGGELRLIWARGFLENHLCGCGLPFQSCPFWSEVTERAFGSASSIDPAELADLARFFDRRRYFFRLLRNTGPRVFREKLHNYRLALRSLYEAIAATSGCQMIIDSSKWPTHPLVLGGIPSLSPRILHLVRDSRAVAYSWQRKKRRDEIHWKEEYMATFSPFLAARGWVLINLLCELLRFRLPVSRIRYEDFVANPSDILTLAPLAGCSTKLRDEDAAPSFVQHTVSGNPVRFDRSPIEITNDSEWRDRLPRQSRALVTVLTIPLLLRYGYFK